MKESDRVGLRGRKKYAKVTTLISGVFHRFCKSTRSARRRKKKRWNVCTDVILLHIYTKRLCVRLQVCPVNKKVLMLIKL